MSHPRSFPHTLSTHPCHTDPMAPAVSLPSKAQEPSAGHRHLQGEEPTQRGGPCSQAQSRGCGYRERPPAGRGVGGSLHTCISLSSVLTPHGEGQPAQAHNVPRFLGDSESPALIAPQEKPPLRARGGPVRASGAVRGARGCVGSWASGRPGWRLFAHLVRSGPLTSAQSGPMYRVSDDVVVHLPCAVDANNAKDHEDHGPCVHQRPHGWLPAARVHAGVEAEGGREAGLGHCRGSHICMRRRGPASRGPTSLPACTFLTGHIEEAFGRAVGAGAEQAAGRRGAHAPVERRLVGLSKVHFPAEAKEPG